MGVIWKQIPLPRPVSGMHLYKWICKHGPLDSILDPKGKLFDRYINVAYYTI